jgi:hypothetical protein
MEKEIEILLSSLIVACVDVPPTIQVKLVEGVTYFSAFQTFIP